MSIDANKSLLAYNTFGFDQQAEHFAEVADEDELIDRLATAAQNHWPVMVLGGGSNIVLAGDVAGLVIRLVGQQVHYSKADADGVVEVTADAGKNWHELVMETLDRGLPGLENLALIPGSVGAAPVQNIGAYGVELADRLTRVRVLHRPSRCWHDLDSRACDFSYRDSRFKRERDDWIITSVTLELGPHRRPSTDYASLADELGTAGKASANVSDIAAAVMRIRRRRLPDPATIGNAGSFFHNPVVTSAMADALGQRYPDMIGYPQADGRVKLAAGWLIDHLGFRGHRDGGIGVHERQALVLTHDGSATGHDLLRLVETIRQAVRVAYGITLTIEPRIIGGTDRRGSD